MPKPSATLPTHDGVLDAVARIARVMARWAELSDERHLLRLEGDDLGAAAHGVATDLVALPRVSESGRGEPGAGLPELEEWGARARAALFLVRSALRNRTRELSMRRERWAQRCSGEPSAGTSVSLVRRRLQQSSL